MAPPIKAFTYQLGTKEILEESVVEHNAAWVIGVIPFAVPDTFSTATQKVSDQASVETRRPFVIVNDCVSVRISHSKTSPFGSMETMLRSGDINYLGAVMPGDFVFAWISSDRSTLDKVVDNFRNGKAANDFDSGLKFIGRIEAIREHLRIVNPLVGTKELFYTVSATSFQEFNTKVYITPFTTLDQQYQFMSQLIPQWAKLQGAQGVTNVQRIVRAFLNIFMGSGPRSIQTIEGVSPNSAFVIPTAVGKLLDRSTAEPQGVALKFTDILTVIQGIQDFSVSANQDPQDPSGFLPILSPSESSIQASLGETSKKQSVVRQYKTPVPCSGGNVTYGQRWTDVPIWSILQQYGNTTVNELYTCLRVDQDSRIVPTLIMRQVPFSTQEYLDKRSYQNGGAADAGGGTEARQVTPFMSVPRWKANPAMVIEHDIGRSNALRVNYVQVWGELAGGDSEGGAGQGVTSSAGAANAILSDKQLQTMWQFNLKNRVGDIADIKRSGLRSYVTTIPHDFPQKEALSHAPIWARKLSDWTINGHLKLNGTVVLTGITEPICVGDNFEWNGVVFHIEQVTHTAQISPTGLTSFRTILSLSNGLDVRSDSITRYPYMDNMFRETLASQDQERDQIYPGYSDAQDLPGRDNPESPGIRQSPDFNRKK